MVWSSVCSSDRFGCFSIVCGDLKTIEWGYGSFGGVRVCWDLGKGFVGGG